VASSPVQANHLPAFASLKLLRGILDDLCVVRVDVSSSPHVFKFTYVRTHVRTYVQIRSAVVISPLRTYVRTEVRTGLAPVGCLSNGHEVGGQVGGTFVCRHTFGRRWDLHTYVRRARPPPFQTTHKVRPRGRHCNSDALQEGEAVGEGILRPGVRGHHDGWGQGRREGLQDGPRRSQGSSGGPTPKC
jgi:hypothetical protein